MAKNNTVGLVIGTAVALLLGVIFVSIIAGETISKTHLAGVNQELINIASARTPGGSQINITSSNFTLAHANTLSVWKGDYAECNILGIVSNDTGGLFYYNSTDMRLYPNGVLQIRNSTNTVNSLVNTTYTTYTYCPDDYLASGWGRTIADMVPGFFVLAILLGAVFVIIYVLRNEGVDIGV